MKKMIVMKTLVIAAAMLAIGSATAFAETSKAAAQSVPSAAPQPANSEIHNCLYAGKKYSHGSKRDGQYCWYGTWTDS